MDIIMKKITLKPFVKYIVLKVGRIPTVGEILEDEQNYYNLIFSLTATPFQYMVQLDDMGIDFTQITDYELFMMLLPAFAHRNMSILFGGTDLSDILVCKNTQNDMPVLYSPILLQSQKQSYHRRACIRPNCRRHKKNQQSGKGNQKTG